MAVLNAVRALIDKVFTTSNTWTDEQIYQTYLRYGSVPSLPTASATYRGKVIRVEGGAGVADDLYVCEKLANDTYAWLPLAPISFSDLTDVPGSTTDGFVWTFDSVNGWQAEAPAGGGGGGGGVNAGTLLDIVKAAAQGPMTGVVGHSGNTGGCLVSAQTTPNMTVKMAAGTIRDMGRPYILAADSSSNAMTSHATLYKAYLVAIGTDGVLDAIEGTTGATAADVTLPTIPTNHVALASAVLTPNATSVTNAMLTDVRVFVDPPNVLTPQMYGYVTSINNDVVPYLDLAQTDLLEQGGGYIYMPGGLGIYGWGSTFVMQLGMRLVGDGGHTRSQPGSGNSSSTGTEIVAIDGTAVDLIQTYTAVSGYVNPTGSTYAHGIAITGLRFHGRLNGDNTQRHDGGHGIVLASLGEVHVIDDVSVYTMYGCGMVVKESRTSSNGIVSSTPLRIGHVSFHSNGQGNVSAEDGDGAGLWITNQTGTTVEIDYLAGDNNTACLLKVSGMNNGSLHVNSGKAEKSDSSGHPVVFNLSDCGGMLFSIGSGFRYRASPGQTNGRAVILCRNGSMPAIKLPYGLVAGDNAESCYPNFIETDNATHIPTIPIDRAKNRSFFARGARFEGYPAGGKTSPHIPPLQLGDKIGVYYGTGSPSTVVSAKKLSWYGREDGTPGTLWYLKESDDGTANGGTAGWSAKF